MKFIFKKTKINESKTQLYFLKTSGKSTFTKFIYSKKEIAKYKQQALAFLLLYIMAILLMTCADKSLNNEIQITHSPYNHDLDKNDNFSPDDKWLVYDTRANQDGIGANSKIEKVNIESGKKVILYDVKKSNKYGPGVGAVSYNHAENEVAFIHGLLNYSSDAPYEQWRRTGVLIKDNNPEPIFIDARDVTAPFTPGALRGGTHRHEFSNDGQWIGFTYNDAILKKLEDSTGGVHNLRTIGVSKRGQAVVIENKVAGENNSGEWFSALVVEVVPNPKLGSDEISRAAGDSWVGKNGYKTSDGHTQRARAFIGTTNSSTGEKVDEVYIVDIPEDITIPQESSPLEGTDTGMPAPPKGTYQRRLTHTVNSKSPGCEGIVRSSYDGSLIAFLVHDKNNVKQVFTISPLGGSPIQQTFHLTDVEGSFRWHPKENEICYIWENSIVKTEIGSKKFSVLTKPSRQSPTNLVWSHDGNKIAFNRIVINENGQERKQIFLLKLL